MVDSRVAKIQIISVIRLRDKSSSGGAYALDKNTSAGLCAKNAGGAYARGGAYLRDTTVLNFSHRSPHYMISTAACIFIEAHLINYSGKLEKRQMRS